MEALSSPLTNEEIETHEYVEICQSYTSVKTIRSEGILLVLTPNPQGSILLVSAWIGSPSALSLRKALGRQQVTRLQVKESDEKMCPPAGHQTL